MHCPLPCALPPTTHRRACAHHTGALLCSHSRYGTPVTPPPNPCPSHLHQMLARHTSTKPLPAGLLVIPTCQRSGVDLVRWGEVIEDEKDRLLEKVHSPHPISQTSHRNFSPTSTPALTPLKSVSDAHSTGLRHGYSIRRERTITSLCKYDVNKLATLQPARCLQPTPFDARPKSCPAASCLGRA